MKLAWIATIFLAAILCANAQSVGGVPSVAGTATGLTLTGTATNLAFPIAIFLNNSQNQSVSTTGRAFPFSGTTASFSATTEKEISIPFFRGGTLSNFVFRCLDHSNGLAVGTGTNTTFILYTNTVASPFAFTLTADGSTTTTNSGTSSITIPANTSVSWRMTNNITLVLDVSWSVEFYTP